MKVSKWIAPIILVIAWLLVVNYTFNSKPDMNGDNFNYFIYATAIATGEGYADLSTPGAPATSNFPPGTSLLMAPLQWVTMHISDDVQTSIVAQKWLNELLLLGAVLLLFYLLKCVLKLPLSISFTAAFATLFIPRVLHFSTMMMSEMTFLFVSVFALFALGKVLEKEPAGKWENIREAVHNPWLWVTIILIVYAYHTRTQGIALVGAVGLGLLIAKRWWSLGFTVVGFVVGCLPYMIRNKVLGLNGNRYLDAMMMSNPWRPEEGTITFTEMIERFFDTLQMLLFNAIPSTIVPFATANTDQPTYTIGLYLLGIVLLALMGIGFWKMGSLRWALYSYFAATLFVIASFSTPSGSRYLTTIMPIMTVGVFVGLWQCLQWLLAKRFQYADYCTYALLLLLFFAKAGLQEEHEISKQKYPLQYTQFFNAAKEIKKHTPEGTIICSRKPAMMYMYSNRPGVNYKYTLDDKELIANLVEKNVDYVVIDALGYSSTPRYLVPAIQKNMDLFSVVLHYQQTHTYLMRFDREKAMKKQ